MSFDWGEWWNDQISDTAAAAGEWRANWVRRELGLYGSPSPDGGGADSMTEVERPTEEPRESVSTLTWVIVGAVAVIALAVVLK